jgi:hypothetical protein
MAAMRRVQSVLALVIAAGCRDRVEATRVDVTGADGLWGGAGFCARTAAGLSCWNGFDSSPGAVVVVDDVKGVKDVAFRSGEGCALHEKGVSCFRPGDHASHAMEFEAPVQIVSTHGFSALICVLHAKGVSCWGGPSSVPSLSTVLGKPKRLFAGEGSAVLCGVYDDGTRCFPLGNSAELLPGIFMPGVNDPRGAMTNTIGGHAWVVDGDKALYGEFSGTLHVTGNPFAAKDPLDVATSIRPFTGATVMLRPVTGVGPVRGMASYSIWPLVLDDRGVAQLDFHGGSFDIKRWPVDKGVPTAIFTGFHDDFFTVDAGVLHERGWRKGSRIDREVVGLSKPTRLFAEPFWTCALEESGGIGCVRSPKI